MTNRTDDCLVVGGGPAGLTAAIYLARYHLDVMVVEDGRSRAATIPLSRNHAGFPDGIGGSELLDRMRSQAAMYGVVFRHGHVGGLTKENELFHLCIDGSNHVFAKSVVLATGVFNRRPPMETVVHDEAVARGLLRYCPVCDAYEITDRPVAVIGTSDRGVNEAVFLRSYTDEITLISPEAGHEFTSDQRKRLEEHGIKTVRGPPTLFQLEQEAIAVAVSDGVRSFAAIYSALGSDIRSELAAALGAKRTEEGCVIVDQHQRTSIPSLYAAGDVVLGLDQISHAMGQAGVAATAVRNDLCERAALIRVRTLRSPDTTANLPRI
jgi:thioredoxin reductase (NADPH)